MNIKENKIKDWSGIARINRGKLFNAIAKQKKINKSATRGFTLIESIVALSLGIVVVVMIVLIVMPGLKHTHEIKQTERLHSNALFLLNSLTYWIKQGENLTVVAPSVLEIKLPNSSIKTISKSDDHILVDSIAFTTNDVRVTDLSFIPMDNSVRISVTIEDNSGLNKSLSIETAIARRNYIK